MPVACVFWINVLLRMRCVGSGCPDVLALSCCHCLTRRPYHAHAVLNLRSVLLDLRYSGAVNFAADVLTRKI